LELKKGEEEKEKEFALSAYCLNGARKVRLQRSDLLLAAKQR
jgi:hypothetical protein